VDAGEVDDDRTLGRPDDSGPLVVEADEDDVGSDRERVVVRQERRQGAVEADVERRGRRPGERVGTQCRDL
jgi:hypothetical protein